MIYQALTLCVQLQGDHGHGQPRVSSCESHSVHTDYSDQEEFLLSLKSYVINKHQAKEGVRHGQDVIVCSQKRNRPDTVAPAAAC